MNLHTRRLAAAATLLALAGTAAAHTGHDTHGFLQGLQHPLALDHLLAMVAVGAWSAAALKGSRRWLGPLTFLLAMAAGALIGVATGAGPMVELGIAASVVLMGVMLVLRHQVPPALGLVLVAGAASLHGMAHGAELPAGAGMAAYAAGFLVCTAALQAAGLAVASGLGQARVWMWRAAGVLMSGAGLLMLAQA